MIVDAATNAKSPAFDHERLAAALSNVAGASFTAVTLPFSTIRLTDHERSIEVAVADFRWKCSTMKYSCEKVGSVGRRAGEPFRSRTQIMQEENRPAPSPDGKWEALIQNFNIYVRPKGKADVRNAQLGWFGRQPLYVDLHRVVAGFQEVSGVSYWTGYRREVHYVESSPADQLQPKYSTIEYAKPGDVLDFEQPMLSLVEDGKQIAINNSLFPNPYELSELVWRKDSRAFTFEYNQRGTRLTVSLKSTARPGNARPHEEKG